ncbi:Molybdopterin biosynthesis MoaE [Spinellus fusiger]|nr:Molybdopterin biosynthesis MoaE [Spinellus fusiger]
MSVKQHFELMAEDLPGVEAIMKQVADDGAGGTSVFVGTTRDTFQGKRVVQLEYDAYTPMAICILKTLTEEARVRWAIKHVAIYHRVGCVPVGQSSVIVAVSSAHRGDAIHATEFLIDELKARCPIWKKEVYEDGSVWKGVCNGP